MQFIKLKSGSSIPILGLGTWKLKGSKCKSVVEDALNLGYLHIDTADLYENHKSVGEAIKSISREKIFLTSKIWFNNLDNPKPVVSRFLKELDTPYLDLLLIHWPDSSQSMVKAFSELQELKKEGLVKNLGVSNFSISHLKNLVDADLVPDVNQVEFHPLLYQKDLLSFCKKYNIVLTAYSPFGHAKILSNSVLKEIAKSYNKSVAQICLAWLFEKEIVAIPKASSIEHLNQNLDSLNFNLLKEDIERIDSLNENLRTCNPSFAEFDE